MWIVSSPAQGAGGSDEDEDVSMVYDTMYVNISEIVEAIIRSLYTEKIDNFINRVNEML